MYDLCMILYDLCMSGRGRAWLKLFVPDKQFEPGVAPLHTHQYIDHT